MSSSLSPGTVVAGRYRLDRLLGRGGMGEVWAVTHEVTRRAAALKFLNAQVHPRPDRRQRFLREARAASAVNHPNVVQIHDFFELDDGTPVMLMDLLEGETLGQRLARERSLPLAAALDILLPVISAVGTAHSVGIVHRDLKPDNVFLLGSPGFLTGVCVLDFGIAKLMSWDPGDTDGLTDTGALLGTPSYMSPEQSFGEADVDHRTDIWSIGVMLYESLAGTRPVEGENPRQVLKHLVSEVITPVDVLVPELPRDVAELIGSMLTRNVTKRPQDLREVLEVLVKHGGVRVQGFDRAVRERPSPLDSSPTSVRSSPYAVIRAPDAEARTIAGDPPEMPGGSADLRDDVASSPLPLAPGRSRGRRGWILAAGALASGLVYGAVRLFGNAVPAPAPRTRHDESPPAAIGNRAATPTPVTSAGEGWAEVPAPPLVSAAPGPSAASPSPTENLAPASASPRERGRAAAKAPSAQRPATVRKATPPPAGGPGLIHAPPF